MLGWWPVDRSAGPGSGSSTRRPFWTRFLARKTGRSRASRVGHGRPSITKARDVEMGLPPKLTPQQVKEAIGRRDTAEL